MPAIIVNAYNRPASLARLLESLSRARIPSGTRLVISIDGGGDPQVVQIAQAFPWIPGPKEVLPRPQNLGLVGHFLACGALTRRFGDIVYLEDDLAVSRSFFAFASQALDAYREERRIAGISLNRLWFNGYTQHPFFPLPDAADVFFAAIYWYQGQAYTARMWADFETWWQTKPARTPGTGLHPLLLPHPRWENDFFPDAMHYLANTGRFFAFPRESHTTHFGDPGTHFPRQTGFFHTPLQHHKDTFALGSLDEAPAVYDGFYELLPDRLQHSLPGLDFDVDLNGTRPADALQKPYVLTTRPVRSAERTFALALRPPELNVLDAVPGTGIALARRENVRMDRLAALLTQARLHRYHHPNDTGLRRRLLLRLASLLDRSPSQPTRTRPN